ncbi:MAG: DUF2461 domain-containing protein [Pseudomonadota bacterium]
MADGFAEMVVTANGFFAELARNNSKDWYEPRKAFYTTEIKKPAELLGNLLAEDFARLTGKPHKPKIFRIHRDVRFSKDKTPYNAHLHILWTQQQGETAPAWFFGSAPDYISLSTGVMGLQGDRLTRFRAFVDREGDALTDAIEGAAGAEISTWGPDPLKRVPKPYDQDHPHAELLKRKNLIVTVPPAGNWKADGLVPAIVATAEALLPVWRLLDEHLG